MMAPEALDELINASAFQAYADQILVNKMNADRLPRTRIVNRRGGFGGRTTGFAVGAAMSACNDGTPRPILAVLTVLGLAALTRRRQMVEAEF